MEYDIVDNKFGKYCIPKHSKNKPAAFPIHNGELYEPLTLDFMLKNCSDGDVVHAGTFFGGFLPTLSKGIKEGRKVWAFEPNPENYQCALKTKELNSLNNVELYNIALGEKKCEKNMKIKNEDGRFRGGGSKIVLNDDDYTVKINMNTLDEIIPNDRKITILQFDVEEYEIKVLEGSMSTIIKWKPILILENIMDNNWFKNNILSLGYEFITTLHANDIYKIK